MPRMTRATARTQIHEDEPEQDAAQVPLPPTPQRGREQQQISPQRLPRRAPLGEITLNPQEEEPRVLLEVNLSKPAKKPKAKSKKTKAGKKAKKADERKGDHSDSQPDDDKENTPEVAEDDIPSRPSSAAEEACADLLKETKQAIKAIHDRPSTPPSRAVRAARKKLSPKKHSRPQTPHFDPDVHRAPLNNQEVEQREDSFVKSIESRSPTKISEDPFVDDVITAKVEQSPIMSPSSLSPVKSPRPEDSIEAIDAAVEALEALGHDLPEIEDDPISPTESKQAVAAGKPKQEPKPAPQKKAAAKPTTKTVTARKATEPTRSGSIRRNTTRPVSPKPATKPVAPRLATSKPVATKPAPGSKPTISKRPTASSSSSTSSKPATKPLTMPIRHKPRVPSITKTPFAPVKSTKEPTKSSFTLPGDAVAARLKEQREKRAEEAAAQPAVKSMTMGRTPATRPSLANAKIGPGGTVRVARTPRATILPDRTKESSGNRVVSTTSTDSMAVNVGGVSNSPSKRGSATLARMGPGYTRASIVPASETSSTTTVKPSTTAKSAKPPTTITNAPRVSFLSKTMPAQNRAAKTASVTSARELFVRESKADEGKKVDTRTLTKKEKEEAAKKARAEAAERGRQASKEWAEKMKARQAAVKAKRNSLGQGVPDAEVAKASA